MFTGEDTKFSRGHGPRDRKSDTIVQAHRNEADGCHNEPRVVVPQLQKRNTVLRISQERHRFETDVNSDDT